MVRPVIRHTIIIGFLMYFVFLFVRVCLEDFFVWRSHIKVVIHWIAIWIVVIRRHSFVSFGIVFVVLSVLIVSSFVGLVVLLWSKLLIFVRIVRCVDWHGRIVVRVSLVSWIYF